VVRVVVSIAISLSSAMFLRPSSTLISMFSSQGSSDLRIPSFAWPRQCVVCKRCGRIQSVRVERRTSRSILHVY
jgi:hypothetical protein